MKNSKKIKLIELLKKEKKETKKKIDMLNESCYQHVCELGGIWEKLDKIIKKLEVKINEK